MSLTCSQALFTKSTVINAAPTKTSKPSPPPLPPISERNKTTEGIPAVGRLLLAWDSGDSQEFIEEFNKARAELEELRSKKKKWDEQLELSKNQLGSAAPNYFNGQFSQSMRARIYLQWW